MGEAKRRQKLDPDWGKSPLLLGEESWQIKLDPVEHDEDDRAYINGELTGLPKGKEISFVIRFTVRNASNVPLLSTGAKIHPYGLVGGNGFRNKKELNRVWSRWMQKVYNLCAVEFSKEIEKADIIIVS